MTSTHSSYRQAPIPVPLSYHQASAFSGVRPPAPMRSYSPDPDDLDTGSTIIHGMPSNVIRSRTTTPFGSHKSLSESIQSMRSNHQPISLPMKKRSQEPPPLPAPIVPKRDQRSPSPKSADAKKDYQHHHYHNPAQLRAQQQQRVAENNNTSSEEDELEKEQPMRNISEDSAVRIRRASRSQSSLLLLSSPPWITVECRRRSLLLSIPMISPSLSVSQFRRRIVQDFLVRSGMVSHANRCFSFSFFRKDSPFVW